MGWLSHAETSAKIGQKKFKKFAFFTEKDVRRAFGCPSDREGSGMGDGMGREKRATSCGSDTFVSGNV